jgi:hypothetical protein
MSRMLGQLQWWALALREARNARSYSDASAGALVTPPVVAETQTV